MRKKVIYLAGPYRAESIHGVVKNIRISEEYLIRRWKAGAAVISPHKNSALLDGADGMSAEDWLDGDFAIVRKCDALFLLPGWENSVGAMDELSLARRLGIKVFADDTIDQCIAWIKGE